MCVEREKVSRRGPLEWLGEEEEGATMRRMFTLLHLQLISAPAPKPEENNSRFTVHASLKHTVRH